MNRRELIQSMAALPLIGLTGISVDVDNMTAEEAQWWLDENHAVELSTDNVLAYDDIPQEIIDEINSRGRDFASCKWDLHGKGNHNTHTRQLTFREENGERSIPVITAETVINPETFETEVRIHHSSRSYFARINIRNVDPTKVPRANDDSNNVFIVKRVLGHTYKWSKTKVIDPLA